VTPDDGILYEPRVLWDVARIDTTSGSGRRPINTLPFSGGAQSEAFENQEKYPLLLTHVIIDGVNYAFDQYVFGAPATIANMRNSRQAALEFCKVLISSPQRQYYTRAPMDTSTFRPLPSWSPPYADFAPDPATQVDSVFSDNLWGLYTWDFDQHMIIPRQGTIDFEFGSIQVPGGFALGSPSNPLIGVGFMETTAPRGGQLPGNMRVSNPLNPISPGLQLSPSGTAAQIYGSDGFGGPTQGNTVNAWPPNGIGLGAGPTRFRAKDFDQQNVSSSGSSAVGGFRVQIDQIDWDFQVDAQQPGGAGLGNIVAPVGSRLPTRVRMSNGGTGAWWWRPGAPLSLVCPTMTPGNVYKLPEPITLNPGDKLDLELEVPQVPPNGIDSVYQIGVSVCGSAIIGA